MVWIAIAAWTLASQPGARPDRPAFPGRDFEALVRQAREQCPAVDVAHLSPAGLLDIDEQFRDGLTAHMRRRLDATLPRDATDGIAACAGHDGASCDAMAYLAGFRRSGAWPSFVRYICRVGTAR